MSATSTLCFIEPVIEGTHNSGNDLLSQNQALNALVFLYKQVIKKELGSIDAVRARRLKRLPVVLTQTEVERILTFLSGILAIMASIGGFSPEKGLINACWVLQGARYTAGGPST